jgi:RNA polymerase sigma-70 factor, ECF subfamily
MSTVEITPRLSPSALLVRGHDDTVRREVEDTALAHSVRGNLRVASDHTKWFVLNPVVAAATAGDESAFSELVHRYGRELRAHCYRMLGSHEDAEDLTQETFLRAWRSRESFRGRSSFRAWLYGIATNACLTALERRSSRQETAPREETTSSRSPDRHFEGIATTDAGPDDEVVSKETIELALRVAVRYLPPRQRAVLYLRDVLDWSVRDTAELLETSLASVTSAHQRARTTLRKHLPERRLEWTTSRAPSEDPRLSELRWLGGRCG